MSMSQSISDLCKSTVLDASKHDLSRDELEETITMHKKLQDQLRTSATTTTNEQHAGGGDDGWGDNEVEDEGLAVSPTPPSPGRLVLSFTSFSANALAVPCRCSCL